MLAVVLRGHLHSLRTLTTGINICQRSGEVSFLIHSHTVAPSSYPGLISLINAMEHCPALNAREQSEDFFASTTLLKLSFELDALYDEQEESDEEGTGEPIPEQDDDVEAGDNDYTDEDEYNDNDDDNGEDHDDDDDDQGDTADKHVDADQHSGEDTHIDETNDEI